MRRLARNALAWALLLGAALGVRLAAAAWWESRLPPGVQFGFGDSASYWTLAQAVAHGGPFEVGQDGPQVFRTPGYPMLLAPLFWITRLEPPTMAARVFGAVLGAAAVACVAGLAAVCFDGRAAWVAAVLAAFYPGAVAMSVFLLSEAPFAPLMLLQLIAWIKAWQAPGCRAMTLWALAAGVAAGAATLMRPSWLLFTPFALAIGFAVSRPRARHALIGGMMLLALTVTMTPWWVRNYAVTGAFVPTTLQVGASLYDGWSPRATGASDFQPVDAFQRDYFAAFPPDQRPTPAEAEVELDRRLRAAAVTWAWEHPGQALRLAGVKFLRMWNIWPNAEEFQNWRMRLLVAVGYAPLLALGLWGAGKFAPRGWPYGLCLLPAVYLTALHLVFVASIRYRQPAMLPVIVLAAGILTRGWDSYQAGRSHRE